jgi:predicted transglutaminase-like cysteine proteinase
VPLVLGLTMGLGCAGLVLSQAPAFDYFGPPAADDPWSPKITGWQRRELAEQSDVPAELPAVGEVAAAAVAPLESAPVNEVGEREPAPPASSEVDVREASQTNVSADAEQVAESLRGKYVNFRADRKRRVAREFAAWIQDQARKHYVADGPIDHWATLEETLQGNGDDCDGLELLTFHGLRDLGFGDDEVFRSIVYRPSDGQHHMVTLWFEDPNDPWVIDPTGAMTPGMPRMSQLPSWVPLKVFSETAEYTVRSGRTPDAGDLASNP